MNYQQEDACIRDKLSNRWHSMIDRCYKHTHSRYSMYGGKGVDVADEWLDKETFITDAKTLPGYTREGILEGKLHLDKDSKFQGNTQYSKDKCVFISAEENNKHKPNQMISFKAISPHGEILSSNNQSEFARTHGLRQNKISDCLAGKRNEHLGWKFENIEKLSTTIPQGSTP